MRPPRLRLGWEIRTSQQREKVGCFRLFLFFFCFLCSWVGCAVPLGVSALPRFLFFFPSSQGDAWEPKFLSHMKGGLDRRKGDVEMFCSSIKTSLHLPNLSCWLERISAASWQIFLRGRLRGSHGERGQLFPSTLILCGLEQA